MGRRIGPIAWLLVLLCVPAVSLALGARQPLMDNRPKTSWPAIRAAALLERKTYKQLDAAWLERVPARKQAVRAHAQISVDVFGESTNPSVAVGRRGWLYYTSSLQTCRDVKPTVNPGDAAEVVARTIIATGRRVLIVEPADKPLIHPADAPRYPRGVLRCVTKLQRDLTTRLTKIPGGVDFDAELRRMEAAGQPTFLPHDSHWNYRGRLAYTRLILDFISPGLSRATGLHAGPWHDHHSDLYRQLGLPRTDRDRAVLLRRPARRPVPTGPTVIIGDSQTLETFENPPTPGAPPLVTQLPKGTAVCGTVEKFLPGVCDDALRRASAIAIESVGRNLQHFEAACSRVVTLLAQGMSGVEGRYALLDGAATLADGRVTLGSDSSALLRIVPKRGNVSRALRLIGIPVLTLPGSTIDMVQKPTAGLPAPCSTPQGFSSGDFLILPVPAGRNVSELVVQIKGPPGSMLGPPQEVTVPDPRPAAAR